MKKPLLLIALIACFAACTKDNADRNKGIMGTWELRMYTTGWVEPQYFEVNNGNTYQFKLDSSYIKYNDGQEEKRGKFSINITGSQNGYKYGTITFTNPVYTDAFSIKADTINIGSSAADGPAYQYRKIK